MVLKDSWLISAGMSQSLISKYRPHLERWMAHYDITTPLRIAAFLAQVGHESASFRYTKELASGEAYDTGRLAKMLGNTPEKDGDGQRYKGRGLIQITGRTNYRKMSELLGIDFISHPELIEDPRFAVGTACAFWDWKKLNPLADLGKFDAITKIINGGYNGKADRDARYARIKKAMGI